MNRNDSHGSFDARLDRLVDGEMPPAEYAAFVAELEQSPDGWRRCALAFLEAQAWSQDLRGLRREAAKPGPSPAPSPSARRPVSSWSLWLALAASWMLAFWLGWRGAPRPEYQAPAPMARSAEEPKPVTADGPPVRLAIDRGDGTIVEHPLYDWRQVDEQWLHPVSRSMPPEVRAALERLGGEVRQRRGLVPVNLQDGRRAVIPFEQVEIVPVSAFR